MAKSAAESGDNGLGVEWTSDVKVPVIPLHSLISKYGRPDFIKIDVEGFEEQVLEGLKEVASPLSFEFNPEFSEAVVGCLQKPCFPDTTKFASYVGEPRNENLSRWMNREEVTSAVQEAAHCRHTFGDTAVPDGKVS